MTRSQIDFSSRISVRALASGVVATLALMILFATLGDGLGIWHLDLGELPEMGGGFWTFAFLAWIISTYIGAIVAAVVSRSESPKDGVLHGLMTWAGACLAGCGLLAFFTGLPVGGALTHASRGMFWGSFVSDLIALAAGILGGMNGAQYEAKTIAPDERAERTKAAPGFKPAFPKP